MSHGTIPGSRAAGASVAGGNSEPAATSAADAASGGAACAVSLISAIASKDPTSVAVTLGQHSITYAELESRAAALAGNLHSRGATRGSVVALLASRSIAYVIGALGIMKAGAAYLPVQPGDPSRRVDFQLEDAGAELIVATADWAVPNVDLSRRIVRLAADGLPATQDGTEFALANLVSEDLAYIIYTSGSSGQPKGVEVSHANLLRLIEWHRKAFNVTAADRASFVSNVGVDAAVWELWPQLATGASVHIAGDDAAKDPEALRDWLVAEKITISFAPTLLAERLMELKWPSRTALRILLTGGDVLHSYPPRCLPFQVVNNYGPTECTVVATSTELGAGGPGHGLPPIGRPIADTQIYILDADMRSVPGGEVGEIWIGGAGVARGYRNRLELTAEKFMPDPFAGRGGARMYRTGDRGRILAGGQVAFVGRTDEQVKVRGLRVEPGEIESALNRHPAVAHSSVNLLELAPGEKQLIAHVILQGESAPSANELQAFLAELLAEHMIPTRFVRLAKFPLLASGKIDRAALARPNPLNTLTKQSPAMGHTITEKRVQKIVSSLLQTENAGVQDNFFLLGGHSLLAAQLIARVRDAFAIEIGLRFLFENPTIAAIAGEIERIVRLKVEAMTEEQAHRMLDRDLTGAREGT
jgi:amino acid adenylation domain-containing protein